MNRILKFRAWDKFNEYMEYGIDDLPIWCLKLGEDTEGNLCVFQQYTGLKDKNGKEIYEGDIFKAPHDFGPAGYHERIGLVQHNTVLGYQWHYWLLDKLEVIGNKHENPELLEGADQ